MGASLSWLCAHVAVLRIGSAHHAYGDPYEWSAVIVRDGETARIEGVDQHVTPLIWRTVKRTLRGEGFAWMAYERYTDGRSRWHRHSL